MSDSTEHTTPSLPAILAQDHAALALMPVTLATRDPAEATGITTFRYTIEVDGRPQNVQVTLTPGEGGCLPVHEDQMVYLALLQLALRSDHPSDELSFTRYEVFDVLRWPNSGPYYEKLRSSLDRLAELTIKVDTAMVARDGREYSKRHLVSHLIDTVAIASGRDAVCKVGWGGLVREAFSLHDFKSLDWDLILALDNPLTAQLYRLLDRVTLAGHTLWQVDWQDLAAALGMRVAPGTKPAKIRQRLEPHFERLIEQKVIDSVDYERGGRFVFHIRNYLRSELRRILIEHFHVYERAAAQLVAGHDEVEIMRQADCLRQGGRGRPSSPGGYITEAIRSGYELRYPDDDPERMAALWAMYAGPVQLAYHRAGLKLCGTADTLFDSSPDPLAWSAELRAVIRFMLTWGLEPEEILRRPATLRSAQTLPGG